MGITGELGVCFLAIPALLSGGYAGVASSTSAVLKYMIRPLLAAAPAWLPGGAYTVISALYVAGFPGLCRQHTTTTTLYLDRASAKLGMMSSQKCSLHMHHA